MTRRGAWKERMATLSIDPAENPVVFTASGVREPKQVTVGWSTASLAPGRVTRRIDGGPEVALGSGVSGSVTGEIELNQTHTFTLRSALGQVLATLVVTTVLESAQVPVTPAQRIDISRVAVRADLVYLRWRTAVPVACWVEVVSAGREHGFAGTEAGTVHQVRFEGLDQDTEHTVRILPEGGMARYIGTVHTGVREVSVRSNGAPAGWGVEVTIPKAPRHLWIGRDGIAVDGGASRERVDLHPDLGPVASGLRGVVPEADIPITLPAGNADGTGTVLARVSVTEGTWMPDPEVFRRIRLRRAPDARDTRVTGSTTVDTPGGALRLDLSPDGLLHAHAPSGPDPVLGGPFPAGVHACAVDGGVLLVGTTPSDEVVAAVVDPGRVADADWCRLGRARSVVVTPTRGGAELLTLSGGGDLGHLTVWVDDGVPRAAARSDVGSDCVGACAVTHERLGLVVVAALQGGLMRHRRRQPDGAWGGWTDVGRIPPSHCAVHWESADCLAVTAVDADRTVRVLAWPGYPAARARGDWTEVGTLAGLEDPDPPRGPAPGR
ncbi:hypothetical protein ACFWPA_06620 [Rhodococcus sp. NPDC058505]|uniref:hypothetical protein n=1 Tax=Rhodococcus sp. NPDC058505 TaxID=3346531 RepID=UPI0036533125